MRIRDIDMKTADMHRPSLRINDAFIITPARGKRGLVCFFAHAGLLRFYITIPRNIFDKMCDWYMSNCGPEFWGQAEADISEGFGKDWSIGVQICPAGDSRESLTLVNIVFYDRSGIRQNNMLFGHDDFDRIVRWYNSDIEMTEKAA